MAFLIGRPAQQPEVSADVLPLASTLRRAAIFIDCSKTNSFAYFPDNPCQTFVLLKSREFASAEGVLATEARHLKVSGWHHSAAQPVDYDGAAGAMAALSQSWVAPDRRTCAYVATDAIGTAAEGHDLFPYDPHNQPYGVLAFYRRAQADRSELALWIRLRPASNGHCAG